MKIAVVGGRSLQDDQLAIIYAIGYRLTKAGHVVVSGGAVGADEAGELGARKAGGEPIIFVPIGHKRMHDPRTTVVQDDVRLALLANPHLRTLPAQLTYIERLFTRNAAVAECADAAIGWQGTSGGTRHCFRCFEALGKPYLDLGEAFARNDFGPDWSLVVKRFLYRLRETP